MSVHERIIERLIEDNFDQPLIDNTWRGAYVEYLVEHALRSSDPAWIVTDNWDAWDLEQRETGARIEVKNAAAAQTWTAQSSPVRHARPSFDIAPRTGRYVGSEWLELNLPRRFADLYVFAWHPVADLDEADHRDPEQWQFYVVREIDLPDQKTISLNPLRALAAPVDYGQLSGAVLGCLDALSLKADAAD